MSIAETWHFGPLLLLLAGQLLCWLFFDEHMRWSPAHL